MALLKETLSLLIKGDADGAVQAFRKVGDAADRDLGKAETAAERTSANLTKMGAASLAAGGIAAAALYSTIKPASDLAEAVNVTGLTFGESAAAMEAWADGAAEAFGQSKRQALEGAAAIGGLLQNVGFLETESADLSRQLVVLASDMGSAFNKDPAEALAALRSGLAGESEPLKQFNVFLNEAAVKAKAFELGISDGTSALTDNEKAQARLAIIMEQTSKIQGDFANTADGAANSQRVLAAQMEDLKASIGEAVLPIFQEVVGALNAMTGAFNALPPGMQSVIAKAAVLVTGLLLVGGTALSVAGRVKDLKAAMSGVNSVRFSAATASLGILAGAVQAFMSDAQMTEARIRSMAEAMDEFGAERGVVERISEIAEESEGLRKIFADLGDEGIRTLAQGLADGLSDGDILDSLQGMGVNSEQLLIVIRRMAEEFDGAEEALADFAAISGEAEGSTAALAGSVDSLYRASGPAAAAARDLGGAVHDSVLPVVSLEDALSAANDALDDFFGTINSQLELAADFKEAIAAAAEAIDLENVTLDASTEAGRENIAARGDVLSAINDQVAAMTAEGSSTDAVRAKVREMIGAYRDALAERGLTRQQIQDLTGDLNGLPAEVITQLEMAGYDDALAKAIYIQALYDSIPRNITTTMSVVALAGVPGYGPQASAVDFEFGGTLAGDGERIGRKPGVGRSRFGAGGGDIVIEHITNLDGRPILRAIERVSHAEGGARIQIRAGN